MFTIKKYIYKLLYVLRLIDKDTYQAQKTLYNKHLKNKQNSKFSIEDYVTEELTPQNKECYEGEASDNIESQSKDPLLLAYYLTQFHQTSINDENFGKGFTEWTNVAKAKPQFTGHYQPHIPMDVGFYDLSHDDVMYRQVELAKKYGIGGFCFYYYWFSGQRVLEKPLFNWLNNKELNFPFCLFWANESWESRWFGGDKKTIIEDNFDISQVEQFFYDILPFFQDTRYIKVRGKPLFIIYHPDKFTPSELKEIIKKLQDLAISNGFKGLHICGQGYNLSDDFVKEYGLDAVAEFSPCGMKLPELKNKNFWINPNYSGKLLDCKDFIEKGTWKYKTSYSLYKGVFCGWDNTPRNQSNSRIYYNMSPQVYQKWLKDTIIWTREHNSSDEQIIFINAWNEWGEGAHLEPDIKYGYANLQATRNAIEEARKYNGK